MTNILFISEDYVKSNSSLNDNMFGKNLLPAMREAPLNSMCAVWTSKEM